MREFDDTDFWTDDQPAEHDGSTDDRPGATSCPDCGKPITDEMDSCPYCGDILFRSLRDGTFSPRKGPLAKLVAIIIVLLVVLAVLGMLLSMIL